MSPFSRQSDEPHNQGGSPKKCIHGYIAGGPFRQGASDNALARLIDLVFIVAVPV